MTIPIGKRVVSGKPSTRGNAKKVNGLGKASHSQPRPSYPFRRVFKHFGRDASSLVPMGSKAKTPAICRKQPGSHRAAHGDGGMGCVLLSIQFPRPTEIPRFKADYHRRPSPEDVCPSSPRAASPEN